MECTSPARRSSCSESCGGGVRNRTFELILEARHGGECPGRRGEVQSETCNTHECTVDCVGLFSPWSKCTRSCGEGGTQTRAGSSSIIPFVLLSLFIRVRVYVKSLISNNRATVV